MLIWSLTNRPKYESRREPLLVHVLIEPVSDKNVTLAYEHATPDCQMYPVKSKKFIR